MTDAQIPPALTPEQWASGKRSEGAWKIELVNDRQQHAPDYELWINDVYVSLDDRHAMAAFCLFGQSFGFTQEEATAVAYALEHVGCNCGDGQCHTDEHEGLLRSVHAKISALLPPKTP